MVLNLVWNALKFTNEGQHVCLGGEKGTVSVRDAYTLALARKFDANAGVTKILITPEDCLLASNRNGEIMCVFKDKDLKVSEK